MCISCVLCVSGCEACRTANLGSSGRVLLIGCFLPKCEVLASHDRKAFLLHRHCKACERTLPSQNCHMPVQIRALLCFKVKPRGGSSFFVLSLSRVEGQAILDQSLVSVFRVGVPLLSVFVCVLV